MRRALNNVGWAAQTAADGDNGVKHKLKPLPLDFHVAGHSFADESKYMERQ